MEEQDRTERATRVLDLSRVVSGPYATQVLADLGMDVVRVQQPDPDGLPSKLTEEVAFDFGLNRNKRSVAIDMKSEQGRAAFNALASTADVVFDNFRPGVLERLGADYETLREINPSIISCSITGFGNEGPWAPMPAYDVIVQALGGGMSITGSGEPEGIPCRLGVPIGDIAAGMYAVIGILSALHERDRTGMGQRLEVSLLDAQLALNIYRVPQAFAAGVEFSPQPNRGGAGSVPYGPFRCKNDTWLAIGVSPQFWRLFCRVVELDDLVDDPRFATEPDRQRNETELNGIVETALQRHDAQVWETRFREASIPVGKVRDIKDAFSDEHSEAHGMLQTMRTQYGPVHVAGDPLRPNPAQAPRAPSTNGRDSRALLTEAGISDSELENLIETGVVYDGSADDS